MAEQKETVENKKEKQKIETQPKVQNLQKKESAWLYVGNSRFELDIGGKKIILWRNTIYRNLPDEAVKELKEKGLLKSIG